MEFMQRDGRRTAAKNMIIKGIARFYGGKRNHLITTVTVRPAP